MSMSRFSYLRRSDRRLLLFLLAVGVLASVAVWLAGGGSPAAGETTADSTLAAKRKDAPTQREHPLYYATPEAPQAELFVFDPNTADSTQLLRLGLKPWQVRNIYKYRAAGGIYRRPLDFARLYGLTQKDYRRLEPYIRISADYLPAAMLDTAKPRRRDTLRHPVKIKQTERVVLNMADTTALRKVPGIGPFYANEIIRHGRWLGGYVSVDQLDEIDQFPKEAKKYFVVVNPSPRKLNLNKLSLDALRRHPYIDFYQAKDIVDYRRLRGPLKSLDDLRLSKHFTPGQISRLAPYVEF